MERVQKMCSSPMWLRTHGLKECKLTLSQIIKQISFRHSEDYVHSLKKSVPSQYGDGLFPQFKKDGFNYNLTATPEELQELCCMLEEKAQLYQWRLDWLSTGSRQVFGVIHEEAVTLVLDFSCRIGSQCQLGRDAVCRVLKEQVSQITKFNLVCSGDPVKLWRKRAVSTSDDHLLSAEEWLLGLHLEESSQANAANALLKSMEDTTIQAVYLFVVGDIKDNVTELLRNRLPGNVKPVHTVSFQSKENKTINALRELSDLTAGRVHAYRGGRDGGDKPLLSTESQQSSEKALVALKPAGEIREDVYQVWWEMQEAQRARDILQDIQRQTTTTQKHHDSKCPGLGSPAESASSRAWLTKFGLIPQKLDIYGSLADCAFRHSDGVVDIRCKPMDESTQSDAVTKKKLVNARYCEGFAHMKWKDDSLVHVYIPAEKLRWYEERIATFLQNIRSRLTWLRSGSRDLFGTVVEDQLYLLIDTSESMRDQLPLLKDKIQQLVQEQLCHKTKINIVAFGSQVSCWRNRLTDVNAHSLESVCWWVKGLQAGGSTNTLAALGQAFTDHSTQAVYLLTDGRPDQPIKSILEQVQLWAPVPIHTISFNCDDQEANGFLRDLATETQGRFHCYHPATQDFLPAKPNESEDIHLLKCEIRKAERDLHWVRSLRAECVMLDAFHHGSTKAINSKRPCQRSNSAPIWKNTTQHQQRKPQGEAVIRPVKKQALSKPHEHTGQTEASLLKLVSSSETVCHLAPTLTDQPPTTSPTWMLTETLHLLRRNAEKQEQVLQQLRLASSYENTRRQGRTKPRESLDVTSARWLKKNSLVARRLTLTDALAPTTILHSPKDVPLLEKQVYSRVFDKAVPLLHISNGSEQPLILINPLALNLEAYKEKLRKVLHTYERRLNRIVWKALTQEEKEKDQRDPLLQALEQLGWPLALEDISLLEEQIHTGLSFLQQASDLQQAAKERTSRNTHTNAGCNSKNSSHKPGRKPSQNPPDPLRGQKVIARSEVDGYYYSGKVRRCMKGRRAVVEFTSGGSEMVPLEFLLTVGGAQPCPSLRVGDFVLVLSAAKEGAGDRFLPGVVIATPCRLEAADRLFSVVRPDKKKVHCPRIQMVKISQRRYIQTCLDLKQRHQAAQPVTRRVRRGSDRPRSSETGSSWSQRSSKTSTSAGDHNSAGSVAPKCREDSYLLKAQRKVGREDRIPEKESSKHEVRVKSNVQIISIPTSGEQQGGMFEVEEGKKKMESDEEEDEDEVIDEEIGELSNSVDTSSSGLSQ